MSIPCFLNLELSYGFFLSSVGPALTVWGRSFHRECGKERFFVVIKGGFHVIHSWLTMYKKAQRSEIKHHFDGFWSSLRWMAHSCISSECLSLPSWCSYTHNGSDEVCSSNTAHSSRGALGLCISQHSQQEHYPLVEAGNGTVVPRVRRLGEWQDADQRQIDKFRNPKYNMSAVINNLFHILEIFQQSWYYVFLPYIYGKER